MKTKFIVSLIGSLLTMGLFSAAALADGKVTCTSEAKDKWQAQEKAEEAAKEAGYEVRKSVITDGGCYEVYGIKDGSLFELFYNPIDLTLVATVKK